MLRGEKTAGNNNGQDAAGGVKKRGRPKMTQSEKEAAREKRALNKP